MFNFEELLQNLDEKEKSNSHFVLLLIYYDDTLEKFELHSLCLTVLQLHGTILWLNADGGCQAGVGIIFLFVLDSIFPVQNECKNRSKVRRKLFDSLPVVFLQGLLYFGLDILIHVVNVCLQQLHLSVFQSLENSLQLDVVLDQLV